MPSTNVFSIEAKHERKSARSRAKLLDAAIVVFADMGVEAASIKEITREANMANGTFYLHFKDKEEIVHEVCTKILSRIAQNVDYSISEVTEAVERVSIATRRFIHFSGKHRHWGQAFIKFFWSLPTIQALVTTPLRNDLELGVQQGVFHVIVDDFLLYIFGANLIAALTEHLNGTSGEEAGSKITELLLQMLGVPHDQAKAVAWHPISFEIPESVISNSQ
ncbi:MAG: TetR/AcrR family transcriptional regulator [Henriciella sp.]